jgi:Rrf2 family iron-sulfur cluster assembly transcriptional regulator
VLARDPEQILLSEIVSAVDGPISLGDFGQPHEDGACDHEGQCVLTAVWNVAGEYMRHHLESYTLAAVAAMANGNTEWPSVTAVRA